MGTYKWKHENKKNDIKESSVLSLIKDKHGININLFYTFNDHSCFSKINMSKRCLKAFIEELTNIYNEIEEEEMDHEKDI